MRLNQLPEGRIARVGGRWFHARRSHEFFNDLGVRVYPRDCDAECELVEQAPRQLTENTGYRCLSTWKEGCPTCNLILADADGYRYRVAMAYYGLEILFVFRTCDKRAPRAMARFTSSSGRFAKRLVEGSWIEFRIDSEGVVSCCIDTMVVSGGQ